MTATRGAPRSGPVRGGYVGRRLRRVEDRPLLAGQGRYAADISFPRQLHMRVLRSPVACGRLAGIDSGEAAAAPGVVAVWTGADVAELPPIDFRQAQREGMKPYRQPVLAQDRVRYVGEPVAALFADDPYRAEDAAERVRLDIEEERPCLRATDPPAAFAPGLAGEAAMLEKGYGDLDAAFAGADAVVELTLEVGRHTGVPMETRGAVARYDAARGLLELFGAAKIPHLNKRALAAMLGLAPGRLHLYEDHVGGGFGIRGELYPEDALVCLAALRLGRPVKWIEDRREHLTAANHARDQVHRIRAAVDRRGFVRGLDSEFWSDQGAYLRTHAATVADMTSTFLPGPYQVPAYRARGHIRLTNKTPAGTYRAPGRYESTFVHERLLDAVADRLGLDPVEVRRANLIPPEAMPFVRPLEAIGVETRYDAGDMGALLTEALAAARYEDRKAEAARRRTQGEAVGVGVGCFLEKSGLGPFDGARISIDEAGQVEVVTGAASMGQGMETALAQICADALGARFEDVRIVHGRTDRIAYGMGAFASRVTVMAGSAVHLAARRLRARIEELACELLQAAPGTLEAAESAVSVGSAAAGPRLTFAELAQAAAPASPLVAGRDPGLEAEGWFRTDHMTYPFGVHLAMVRVDRETCGVEVERYAVAAEVGRAVNPMLIEGQLAGGVAQGVGAALLEWLVYDESGQPLATSLMDYLMPTAAEMPELATTIAERAPSPGNPLGVKGVGEAGINAAGAAIAAAIDDAIGRPGAVTRLPVTPARLHALLHGGEGGGAAA